MSWKKIFAATSSILYLILISLLFYYYRLDFLCGYKSPCIRFCSAHTEKYSDKILFDSLKKDNMTRYYDPKYDEIKFLRGPPTCNVQLINIDDKEVDNDRYNSSSPKYHYMFDDGTVQSRSLSYTVNKNCLELEDASDDEWAIMVCANESLQQPSIPIIMTIFSLIILASTLTIYSYFSELRDFHGKMIILLLSSMICTYIFIPGISIVYENAILNGSINLLIGYGFTSGNLLLNSMILNIYFRCRDFKIVKPKDDKFKAFAIYVSIFTIFALLFIVFDMLVLTNDFSIEFISIVHYYLIFTDLVILIVTSIIIRNISKQIEFSERAQLEKEKKMFWIYVKLFAIMSVTWSTQIFTMKRELNDFGSMSATLIMLFSAVNVSGLFLGRKKARELLFGKYRGEENN